MGVSCARNALFLPQCAPKQNRHKRLCNRNHRGFPAEQPNTQSGRNLEDNGAFRVTPREKRRALQR
eukprot:10608779-Lingulodinium_polyedra.AAC.1